MKVLITSLVALLLAVIIGVVLSQDAGRFMFMLGDYTVQGSLSLFAFALFTLLLLSYILFRTLSNIIHLPENIRRWKKHRRARKSEFYLSQGFLALVEGNWTAAEKAFKNGASYSRIPMINYLGAARAAQQQGNVQRRDHYLRMAHEYGEESKTAVGLTQAELQLNQEQTEQAYATLQHLNSEKPGQDQIKLMLLETSSSLKDWKQSLALLQELEKKKILPSERVRAKQQEVYAGLLRSAGDLSHPDHINAEWKNIPKKLQEDLFLIETYITQRLRYKGTMDCELLLRKTLKKKWDVSLARLYGLVEGEFIVKQLGFAEKLLSSHPREPILLLTLGRLSKRNDLWGKAASYFEESIKLQPYPETYYELASLLEEQGESKKASEYFQKGLKLATNINN